MWCTNRFNIQQLYALPTLYLPLWSKSKVNAAAGCDPTEWQGSSIREAMRRNLVTVCDKFERGRGSQSVWATGERTGVGKCAVNHGSRKKQEHEILFKTEKKKKSAKEAHKILKLVYVDAAVSMKTVLQVVRAIS